jgi:ATP-binding cassette subfamily F protein uup
LNNVVTSTLVFENDGMVNEYVGGYDDWLRQRKVEAPAAPMKSEEKKEKPKPQREKPRKLTFKEQKELEALPQKIEALEAEQQQIHATMADPKFYRESGDRVNSMKTRIEELKKELAQAYKRWEELEAVKG